MDDQSITPLAGGASISGWKLWTEGWDPSLAIVNGNRFLIGNGYLGYRGTLEEAGKEDLPATIPAGLYDRSGVKWREPVNAPNGLFVRPEGIPHSRAADTGAAGAAACTTSCSTGAGAAADGSDGILEHRQELDFRYGLHSRKTVYTVKGARAVFTAERFASMADPHLLSLRCTLEADRPTTLTVVRGADCGVYDINGPHFGPVAAVSERLERLEKDQQDERQKISVITVSTHTLELDIPFAVSTACSIARGDCAIGSAESGYCDSFSSLESLTFNLQPGEPVVFEIASVLATGNDFCNTRPGDFHTDSAAGSPSEAEIAGFACGRARTAVKEGFDALFAAHAARWDEIWKTGDVEIDGDPYAQSALRYSLYQLQIAAPRHRKGLSVPARALSGQTYKGAVFWDTEMFIAPYFLATDPAVAESFVRYRIDTLGGAKRKARSYGFEGAFYAWESQETGDDACTDFNVVDVFTGRPVRTFFRDKQVHISADAAYALGEYVASTGDRSILREGGFALSLECAKFFMSCLVWKPLRNRYELHDVIGPDEYHERVNNNAFTNLMAARTLDLALSWIAEFEAEDPAFLERELEKAELAGKLGLLRDMREKLYIPAAGPDGVIEQFDGYYACEDCTLDEVRSRLVDKREYWGGSSGVAGSTQIIKQADVALALVLFPEIAGAEAKKANFDFYEKRTEHGSSLSPCVYALLACETGNPDWGYPYFLKTAGVDLTGESKQFAGLVYIGGTHPAAAGGAWLAAVKGFCGYRIEGGKPRVENRLPARWQAVRFKARIGNAAWNISVTKEGCTVCEE